jgi:DNA repair protein RadC
LIIANEHDATELFATEFARAAVDRDALATAYLSEARELIHVAIASTPAGGEAELPVRRILEEALTLGARGLVTAHRRPTDEAEPTPDLISAVRELAETSTRLGIRLHDHLILAGEETCSLRALGLL